MVMSEQRTRLPRAPGSAAVSSTAGHLLKRFDPAELRDAHGEWTRLGEISTADLRFTDGKIKHVPSGLVMATASHERFGPGSIKHTVSHVDGTPVYSGTSKKDALAAIVAHHNQSRTSPAAVHVSAKIIITGASDVDAQRINNALQITARLAPSVIGNIDGINVDFGIPGSGRHHRAEYRSVISINPKVLAKGADYVLRQNTADGTWSPAGNHSIVEYAVTHEAGHAVAVKMFGQAMGSPLPDFWSDLRKRLGITAQPPAFPGTRSLINWLSTSQAKQALAKQTSIYGATKPSELLAELWAEYALSDQPRAAAKWYGDHVTASLAKRFPV